MGAAAQQSDPAPARHQLEAVAAAFRSGAQTYTRMGSPLYGTLCAQGAANQEVIELASHAQAGAQPVFHVLASVHYLLLQDPSDPLSRYFATMTDTPAPADQAFPEFARFCRERRDDILKLLATRTVQTTYVERCASIMPCLSFVADQAGEPLNLIEIGCSAGVLLTFDKYAYDFKGLGRIGSADAPLVLTGEVRGGPKLHIPKIGTRVGLDLNLVDVRSAEERRWIIALTFPEYRDERARLTTALDTVAKTDIRMLKGDALHIIPGVLAETKSPVCIYHSACLMYWNPESREALDERLTQAGRERDIYRVGIEPSAKFEAWHKGRAGATDQKQASQQQAEGEVTFTLYRGGKMERRVIGRSAANVGTFEWVG